MSTRTFDVVVAGAGPAGSLAALQLARAGAGVLLVERRAGPRGKVCGGCLGPGAVAMLHRLDIAGSVLAGAAPVHAMALSAWNREARIPLDGHVAVSRSAFDASLTAEAVSSGATLHEGVRVVSADLVPDAIRLTLDRGGHRWTVTAGVAVDATGLGRGFRIAAGRREGREDAARKENPERRGRDRDSDPRDARIGLGVVLDGRRENDSRIGPKAGRLHMVVGEAGYVGAVRSGDGAVHVAAAVDRSTLAAQGPAGAVEAIVGLERARAWGLGARTPWAGTPPLGRGPGARAECRVFRIGDRAGFVEPFTGEGMSWAMASAAAVVPIVLAGLSSWSDDLVERWERSFADRVGRRQRLCRVLACGLRRPTLVRGVVGLLARRPALARPVVRAAAGGRSSGATARAVGGTGS